MPALRGGSAGRPCLLQRRFQPWRRTRARTGRLRQRQCAASCQDRKASAPCSECLLSPAPTILPLANVVNRWRGAPGRDGDRAAQQHRAVARYPHGTAEHPGQAAQGNGRSPAAAPRQKARKTPGRRRCHRRAMPALRRIFGRPATSPYNHVFTRTTERAPSARQRAQSRWKRVSSPP